MENKDTGLKQILNWRNWLFPARPDLPQDLTTYDWLKTAAIVLMIIDHIGFYMFPDIEWFRVVGRLCAPIFFFLIGYANTRDIPMRWIAAIFILMAANLAVGLYPLPLVILMTMILVRLTLNPLMLWLERHPVYLWWVVLLLIFGMIPTDMMTEYGTMGLLIAMAGFSMRHATGVAESFGPSVPNLLLGVSLGSFGVLSAVNFGFTPLACMVLAAGITGLFFILQNFEGRTIAGSANHPHAALIRFTGRQTLDIYVIHLLILKLYFAMTLMAKAIAGT